ncbi:MAG: hypothetical protein JW797_15970, partial [Bradymonadales bacterium]|nr:hypothetical protein [Bradymonadales bacterium]
TFKSGSLGIKVEKSVFKSFSAAVNADVEVRGIQGAKGPLKLNGDIKLDWNPKGIDVNTTLALVGKFVYESGKVTATFNSGSIKIKVEKSVFKSFSAQVDVNVEVKDIPGATSTLKLHSNLKIDWSQKGIDIDATLDLLPSFTYERGKVSLVFNSGSIKLKIDKGRFTSFKFDVNATILVKEIPNCASPLVVNGKIDGTYSESKIDINASLTLIPPFVYEQGSFKANFLGGTLSLVITNSDLIEFGVSGLKIQAEMKIAGKTIKATGDVFTGKYIKGNIDLKAKVTLDPPPIEFKSGEKFGFELDPGSFVEISVTKSKLDYIKGKVTGKVNWEGPFLQIDAEFTYSEAGVDVDGSAKLLALKKIFGPVGDNQYAFWLRPTEGYTATISVKKGDLKEVGGSIAFKVTDKGGDLIVGSAEGKWEAKTGKFTGGGGIFLGRDLDFTVGDFTIKFKKDSGGGGKVEDSKLIELSGRLTCEIWDKDGKFVTVEASGKYNAVDNNIEHAEGSLTLNRPWSLLGGKIIVSNVKGSGLIKDNKIRSVSGSAEIDMPDWNIKGGFTKISWSNLTGQDVYEGSGWLHVKLLGGKVEGRVTVRKFKAVGGSTEFDVGGEVKYQLNKYLGGKLTVDIDQNLDPKLGGTLEINNAELYPGRDLINKVVEIVPPVGASVYGITFGAGCDAALKVQLLPVLFSGNIGVSNFYPLRMNVPRFDMTFGVSTGVKLQASLIPYLFLGLGVPSVSAGVKLKGRVSLNVPVVVSAGLHLFADESTFGGDFTVGASIRPSLELGFQPVLYARAGGASTPDYPLMEEKTYTFPDLFVFEWNKKFLFGDAGHDEAAGGGAPAPQPSGGPVTQEQQAATSATAPVEQEPTGPAVDNQQPDIGAAEQTSGQGGQDGQASEMEQKFKRIEEIAGHIANIAALVEFAADVLTYGTLLSFIQPFPLNYLVCALGVVLIKHGGSFQFLADGVKSLVWLIGELADWIWGLMPPWLKNIWARFKALYDMGAAAAAKTVGQDIRAACNNIFGSTWGPVLQPLFDWLADRASNLISALGELTANPITWVKCILMIVADAISGVVDFFRALGRVIRNIKKLLEKLVREGDIAAIDLDTDDWCKDPFGTYINIPSLLEGYRSGPSDDCGPWAVGMAVQWGIDTFLDVPKSHRGSKDGWDYGGKFT